MKNKSLRKDFFMEIKKSPARFISIFFIVAMGVAFFSGIRSAESDMKITGDAYFDSSNLMDIKAVSTWGLTSEDIQAIRKVKGVEYAEGSYSYDYLETRDDQDKVVHVMALSEHFNLPTVTKGRLPEKAGECLIDDEEGYQVGDMIHLRSGDGKDLADSLKTADLTIVGTGNSAAYISFNRGNASIGNGSISSFILVTEDSFSMEYYTEAYVQVEDALSQTTYTDAYQNQIDYMMDEIDKITEERCQARRQSVVDDALEELDDARKELEDAKQKAEKELGDGKKELEDAENELADAKKQLDDASSELADGKKQLETSRKQLDDAKKQLEDGEKELAEGEKQLAAGQKELTAVKKKLEKSQKELDGGLAEYQKGEKQYEAGKKAYDQAYQEFLEKKSAAESELSAAGSKIDAAFVQLKEAEDTYAAQQAVLEGLKAESPDSEDDAYESWAQKVQIMEAELSAVKTQLDVQSEELNGQKAAFESKKAESEAGFAAAEKEFAVQKKPLDENRKTLDQTKKKLESAQSEIDAGWKEIRKNEKKLSAAEKEINENRKKLESGKKSLESGEKKYQEGVGEYEKGLRQYKDGVKEYEKGMKEYLKGVEEYKTGKKEADEKISDAEIKIADAEKEIDDIGTPKWYIYDRSTLPEHSGYGENADRMKALGKVFPLIFFLVAALISLTNMTRMVEEQRINIGTLKALGYSNRAIAGKYLGYALLATVGGSVVGVLFGEKLFPYVIMIGYSIMYHHMPKYLMPYNLHYGLVASGAAIICITLATLASCLNELRETPSVLMRPPAPKTGKKTFLEKIPFIWNLLNFSWKSTIRNLFRYKKRFFMTIFGISGCMGLMVFGYGLRDSIYEITQLQYTDLQVYKGIIYLQEEPSDSELDNLQSSLKESGSITEYMDSCINNITLIHGKKQRDTVLMVMSDTEKISDYVHFRDRVSGETYTLDDEGAIISEKTAKLLNASEGDKIQIKDEKNGNKEVVISHITENYMGHYLYLTPEYYEKVYGEQPDYNTILFKTKETDTNEQVEALGSQIMKQDAVLSIGYMHNIQDTLDNMLSSLNMVIIVLIISAGLLAFVVLFNLNEVNIAERRRELATLKVLGFRDTEVAAYVFRENVLLTLFGVLGGCIFGKYLHSFTIQTVEVDAAMFGRIITPKSFLYAMFFTILFSVLINAVMYFKLKKIDMVESLKSIE